MPFPNKAVQVHLEEPPTISSYVGLRHPQIATTYHMQKPTQSLLISSSSLAGQTLVGGESLVNFSLAFCVAYSGAGHLNFDMFLKGRTSIKTPHSRKQHACQNRQPYASIRQLTSGNSWHVRQKMTMEI